MSSQETFAHRSRLDIDARATLLTVASRLRSIALLRQASRMLVPAIALSAFSIVVSFFDARLGSICFFAANIVLLATWAYVAYKSKGVTIDTRAAARAIERENASLGQLLSTALENEAGDANAYLVDRLIRAVRDHPSRPHWINTLSRQSRRASWGFAILALSTILSVGVGHLAQDWTQAKLRERPSASASGLESVSPGDTSVERGSTVVITARFSGTVPTTVELITRSDTGEANATVMQPSLSDPVVAATVPRIQDSLTYFVRFGSEQSDAMRIAVYDLPDLAQADAALDFPEYTQLTDRVVKDTRRVSAVEGTVLDYTFQANKPLQRAYLVDRDSGEEIELETVDSDMTRFRYAATLSRDGRFRLQLVDTDGRSNRVPPDIRIDALPNNPPQLRFTAPRGDQRLSPIEEVLLQGHVSDDFGLLGYGLSYTVDQSETVDIPFSSTEPTANRTFAADIERWIQLEELGVSPGSLISWYLWAEDIGPDSQQRRTASDLFFAEIRPLDEIYREQDGGGSGQQGEQGGGLEDLVELQRKMSIALFRIRENALRIDEERENISELQTSQEQIQGQLTQVVQQLTQASSRQKASRALDFMDSVVRDLETALSDSTLMPVSGAWTSSQGALQALLSLATNEYTVNRSQNNSGSSSSRNQSQLNQLRFRQDENRYETATEAQPIVSEEERSDMQLLSKLNELSRRQQDVNDQLQALQSALANAEDEAERERIRRELKRLEEEQRQLLADMDSALQESAGSQRSREAREQLQESRDTMQQASEQLSEEQVSQALASGSRARESLDQTREQMRQRAASQFSEAMREARDRANDIAERQQQSLERLNTLAEENAHRLEGSTDGKEEAANLDGLRQDLAELMDQIRDMTRDSEQTEPTLHRKLYDLVRQQSGSGMENQLQQDAELARQGLLTQAAQGEEALAADLQRMVEAIDRAAESVLGDNGSALRFAQSELESLSRSLEQQPSGESSSQQQSQGQPSRQDQASASGQSGSQRAESGQSQPSSNSQPSPAGQGQTANAGSPGGGGGPGEARGERFGNLFDQTLDTLDQTGRNPLTGPGFGEWDERLRTVEELMEDNDIRARLSQAREVAEEARQEFKRHGTTPQWEMVQSDILNPLNEVTTWIRRELQSIEQPEALQPIDRDPVPQEYSGAVRDYYQSLGEESVE